MPLKIDDLLITASAHFASDLHLKAGSFPVMRIGGELHPIADAPRLSPEDTLDMAFSMMSNRQKQKLKEVSEVDIAYSVKSLGRFRAIAAPLFAHDQQQPHVGDAVAPERFERGNLRGCGAFRVTRPAAIQLVAIQLA